MQLKRMTMHPSCPTTSFCDPKLSVPSDTFQVVEKLQGFEGLSALEESAVRLHEVYMSLLVGGFTEAQALTLISKMTRPDTEC